MLITNLNRVQLLSLLPKGGTAAEVGVYKGGFADKIRHTLAPRRLHLIDPWGRDEDDEYVTSHPGRQARAVMHSFYNQVQQAFRDDIATGVVELHRDYSTQAAAIFPDQYFDFVYIDAMHNYENVRSDLLAFKDKLKHDGFILGHDFSNNTMSRHRKFGVVAAVREFVRTEGFELVLLTNETAPTYVLARQGNETTLPGLRNALLNHQACSLLEIHESVLDKYQQVEVNHADGRSGQMMKFG